jgi:PadR family transcriptional regulator, regulatory protein AphA
MNVRTLCLAILNFHEATGYEIRKLSTEGNFSYFVDASYGAIYPALNRLTEEGLVTGRDEVQPGKPARKVYEITPAGRRALIDALSQPPEPDRFKSEFLLVAMCAEYVERHHLEEVIDRQIESLQTRLDSLREARAKCEHAGSNWILDYGINCHQASLQHLRDHREDLLAIARESLSEAAE